MWMYTDCSNGSVRKLKVSKVIEGNESSEIIVEQWTMCISPCLHIGKLDFQGIYMAAGRVLAFGCKS